MLCEGRKLDINSEIQAQNLKKYLTQKTKAFTLYATHCNYILTINN